MAAQSRGAAVRAKQLAAGTNDRIRLNRAPQMKSNHLLGSDVRGMGRALEYFRRVTRETDSVLARALASECGYICGAVLFLFTPRAPGVKRSAPPAVLPEDMSAASGSIRTLSCIATESARVEDSYLRVFDACYGYSIRYSLPMSKGRVVPVNPLKSSPAPKPARVDQPTRRALFPLNAPRRR